MSDIPHKNAPDSERSVVSCIDEFNAQMNLGTTGLLEQCRIWPEAKRLSPELFEIFCNGTHLRKDTDDLSVMDLLSGRYVQLVERFGTRLESIAVLCLIIREDPDGDFGQTIDLARSNDREHAGRLFDSMVDGYWNWLEGRRQALSDSRADHAG